MPKLLLAVDIAEVAANADACPESLDIQTTARMLKEQHPEADACEGEIAESLRATSLTPTE